MNADGDEKMNLGETAGTAQQLVSRDRNSSYGMPDEDFQRTVALFEIATGIKLTVAQGVLFMMCVKMSRETNAHKSDNLIDLCGYADILNWIRENGKDQ